MGIVGEVDSNRLVFFFPSFSIVGSRMAYWEGYIALLLPSCTRRDS